MVNKKLDFIGLSITDLNAMLKQRKLIGARKAKLIPTYKLGDEMALTSVFLSSLRFVKEFRKMIFSNVNLISSGKLHIFTEIDFIDHEKRIDGFICVEKAGKIVDAALLEMKNERNHLIEQQISDYIDIADTYNIPKLITVSNQFVSHPTQSPLTISRKKKVDVYHLSWSFILTVAHILLTDNDTNIEDIDQIKIMQEIVDYLEHSKSGVRGFTEMKDGWKNITDRINKRENIKKNDKDVIEAVESWLQEEKDMALILSRELGILVGSGNSKYKDDLRARIDDEIGSLIDNKYIESVLKVNGAVSNITVRANFVHRSIEFSTTLLAPQDKQTLKGQIGWIRKQISKMENKSPELYQKIKNDIIVSLKVKNIGEERKSLSELEDFAILNKDRYLKEYGFVLLNDMGQNFGSKKNSIKKMEELLLDYYQGVVQHLTKWQKPVPEIKNREIVEISAKKEEKGTSATFS